MVFGCAHALVFVASHSLFSFSRLFLPFFSPLSHCSHSLTLTLSYSLSRSLFPLLSSSLLVFFSSSLLSLSNATLFWWHDLSSAHGKSGNKCAIQHSPSAWASFAPKLTATFTVARTKSCCRSHSGLSSAHQSLGARVIERHDIVVQILVNVIVALHDAR